MNNGFPNNYAVDVHDLHFVPDGYEGKQILFNIIYVIGLPG